MEPIPVQPNPETPANKRSPFLLLLLGLIPLAVIGAVVFVLNTQTPQEAKPPVTQATDQNLDSARILVGQPIGGIYPNFEIETHNSEFNSNIFDGLVRLRNGKIEAALAESWVTTSDPNVWRFNLRRGVKFADGTPFTATDVKFSLEGAVKNKWPIDTPLTDIATVTAVDEYTVEIKTKTPIPSLILLLNSVPMISMQHYNSKAASENAIGTGPYKLVSFDNKADTTSKTGDLREQTIVLTINDYYYGNKPKIKNLTYHYLNGQGVAAFTQENLIRDYQIIETSTINNATAAALARGNFTRMTVPQAHIQMLWLNGTARTNRHVSTATNPFANQKVREAVFLGIDPSTVIKEATVQAKPASQLVNQFVFGYDPSIKRPARNLPEARRLLTEAGFEKGFTVTLDFPNNRIPQAAAIAKQLGDIGIVVKLNPLDKDPGLKKLIAGDFALFFIGWTSDYLDATTTLVEGLSTSGKQNYMKYSNKDLDAIVQQINATQEPAERLRLLQEGMRTAMQELPWLPLWEESSDILVRNNIEYTPSVATITGYDLSGK